MGEERDEAEDDFVFELKIPLNMRENPVEGEEEEDVLVDGREGLETAEEEEEAVQEEEEAAAERGVNVDGVGVVGRE